MSRDAQLDAEMILEQIREVDGTCKTMVQHEIAEKPEDPVRTEWEVARADQEILRETAPVAAGMIWRAIGHVYNITVY